MAEDLETFMTYVDISGDCWLAKSTKKMHGTRWKSMRAISAFPVLNERHMHRIAYALMQPEKYKRLASITSICKTQFCCNGLHYQHGVLNESFPQRQMM